MIHFRVWRQTVLLFTYSVVTGEGSNSQKLNVVTGETITGELVKNIEDFTIGGGKKYVKKKNRKDEKENGKEENRKEEIIHYIFIVDLN